jgi:hypothetical protein
MVAALAVLVSACGGSKSAETVTVAPTAAAMRAAATATADKGTSHLEFTMSMSSLGRDVTMKGTGATDPANHRAVLTFDMKDLLKSLPQDAPIPPGLEDELDEPMTMMIDGTVMYMHFPLLTGVVSRGKQWLKIDVAHSNSELGSILDAGEGTGPLGSDPSSMLQFLQGANKVTAVGREEVRGEQTTHFAGSYTFEDAIAAAPESVRDKIEKAFDGLHVPDSARDADIPFDVWIGDDGLVRRLSMDIDASQFAPSDDSSPGAVDMKMTMEFFDFGKRVEFDLPSDDEVTDVSSVLGSLSDFSS